MALNDSICCMEKFFDPLLTQNGIGTGRTGRKQRKIRPANNGKQRKTEPKRLRFFFGTTYGPEGREPFWLRFALFTVVCWTDSPLFPVRNCLFQFYFGSKVGQRQMYMRVLRAFGTRWAECPCFFEQLREAVGGGATDRLGDLPHGEIRADEQAFRLTHLTERNRPSIIFAGSR